ncbi:MAG: cytochrome c oxidase assembly factor Coa1 family protein [Defluviitaleaceae bacterium]|nr:cytochrome c oxidase assembly factor Coa1 family protein [Defluviitaleaceae bacterium]
MEVTLRKADVERRLLAFVIDHICITIVAMFSFWILEGFFMAGLVGVLLYLCKDVTGGASIGKRVVGLAVRYSEEPDTVPEVPALMLRNIFSFLWPLELLMIMFSRNKRKIGDNLAGTDVYIVPRTTPPARLYVIIAVVAVVGLASFVLGIMGVLRNSEPHQIAIAHIEASEEVRSVVGEITGYGFFLQGNISTTGISAGMSGSANFTIPVRGERGNMSVVVWLEMEAGSEWEITRVLYRTAE